MKWLTVATALLLSLTPVLTLQASEAAAVDWHLPLVGTPRISAPTSEPLQWFKPIVDPKHPKRTSLLLTVTDSNLLAALDAATGTVGAFSSPPPSNNSG